MADAIRFLAMDGVQAANSGHPGMPMGMADAAVALFADHIHVDPTCPTWPDRDRFILSAGHGSMLHYALNHLLGYKDMDAGQLKQFRQLGARTAIIIALPFDTRTQNTTQELRVLSLPPAIHITPDP